MRGRSRSGLPSPESEDISRRRDSRKGQQVPISGLTSLAKTYADEETSVDNHKSIPTDGAKTTETVTTVLVTQVKDNNQQPKATVAKEAADKDKDANHHSKDKLPVSQASSLLLIQEYEPLSTDNVFSIT